MMIETDGDLVGPEGTDLVARGSQVAIEAERSRAIQKVQASLAIAKRFPRDQIEAMKRIMVECQRPALAEKAEYLYPRGGEKVKGPTIRLAEVIARHWGNCKYGFRELEQTKGSSTVEAYCWDLETNTEVTREFTVSHSLKAKGQIKTLSDPRDIYEMVANQSQRRVRACILEIIPGDVVDKALLVARSTLQKGSGEPMIDQVTRLVLNFSKLSVPKEAIEKFLGHKAEDINTEEMADLIAIYNSIKEGASRRSDWFKLSEPTDGGKAAELDEKLAAAKKSDATPSDEADSFEFERKKKK